MENSGGIKINSAKHNSTLARSQTLAMEGCFGQNWASPQVSLQVRQSAIAD